MGWCDRVSLGRIVYTEWSSTSSEKNIEGENIEALNEIMVAISILGLGCL
jgi:hypothetical protein